MILKTVQNGSYRQKNDIFVKPQAYCNWRK